MRTVLRLIFCTAFLAAFTNAALAQDIAVPGEVVLPSGVKVLMLKEGTGQSPSASDRVTVHYRGTLVNGNEFDSSYSRGSPSTFPLRGVIRCWTEGLQQMRVGGRARLTCPSATAYGPRSVGGIPPNSTLIFEVELIAIN